MDLLHPLGTAGDTCTSADEFREINHRRAHKPKVYHVQEVPVLEYHETQFGANAMVLYRKYLKLCILILIPIIFVVVLVFGHGRQWAL